MAVVFVYGGIAPEDVVRGYIVLVVTAIGLGSFGLMCSSLVRRTTAATAITIFGALALTIGTAFVLIFWAAMGSFDANGNRTGTVAGIRTPAVVAYVNPFIAQADVMCGTEATFGGAWCSVVEGLVPADRQVGGGPIVRPAVDVVGPRDVIIDGQPGIQEPQVIVDGTAVDDVAPQAFEQERDALWPKSVVTWLILSVVFLFISIQMVSPTRRWRWHGRPRRSPPSDDPPRVPSPESSS
jgi:hypothetical protein